MNVSTSDPGTGAVLTPACKTHGLYFDDKNEPEEFMYEFDKDIYESIIKQAGKIFVGGSFDSVKDYFDYHVGLSETYGGKLSSNMNDNNIHLIEITSKDSFDDEVFDETDDIDVDEG